MDCLHGVLKVCKYKSYKRKSTCSKYNAHTEPLFKELKLLKIKDIFTLAKLKFAHKFINNKLRDKLMGIPFLLKKYT